MISTEPLPDNVVEALNDDTKSFNVDRLTQLLRDTYYLGPIPVGRGPKKSDGRNPGTPGSGLRRSSDGALYKATKSMRDAILRRALDTGLIVEVRSGYATTPEGVHVLRLLDRCDDCGREKEAKIRKWTVQISRHDTATNYELVTVCPDCGFDKPGELLDTVRSYGTTDEDDALQALKNTVDTEPLSLYGVSYDDLDDWETPGEQAAAEFREQLITSTLDQPFSTALYRLKDSYKDKWVRDACERLADDYRPHSIEHIILKTEVADEYTAPDADVEFKELDEPLPTYLPGRGMNVTFNARVLDEPVTLLFTGENWKYEDQRSGKSFTLTTTRKFGRGQLVVKAYPVGVVGEVIDCETVWVSPDYDTVDQSKIETATSDWKRELRGMRSVAGEKSFHNIVSDRELTAKETTEFARIAQQLAEENDQELGNWVDEIATGPISPV